MKTTLAARCGCGFTCTLKTLASESSCPVCRWPVVYVTQWTEGRPTRLALSRHVDLTVEVDE